jgi:hypothetical protein
MCVKSSLAKPIVLGSALLLAVARLAQSQAAVIPRPDTLGANFDADSPGQGTPSDYDFLVGKWNYRYQARNPKTGAYTPVVTGVWTGTKSHDSFVFEDEFVIARPDRPRSIVMTYRVFDPVEKRWAIQGIGVQRGVWQPGRSWTDGRDRFLVQDNPATKIDNETPEMRTKVRIRYYSITRDHFLWRADGSIDGGVTWLRDVMLIEATRATAP